MGGPAATQIATAGATLAWMFAEWIIAKKPSVLGMVFRRGGWPGGDHQPASGFVTPDGRP